MFKINVLFFLIFFISIQVGAFEIDKHPEKDDVQIQLPCNLSMIFKKVYTSKDQSQINDTKFTAGRADSDRPSSENLREIYVQGGFKDNKGRFFLLAKYELSKAQYKALTENKCSSYSKQELLTPISNISYFEANKAAHELSNFLHKQKSTKLPQKEGVIARLPTENEWEFAARGGLRVSQLEFEKVLPPMKGELKQYAWFQSVDSAQGKVHQSGMLKPNPLGIYDLFGNVQEMMIEPYRAIVNGRLHGQSGGILLRGGGIYTSPDNISSAYRVERKQYNDDGKENKSLDVGVRFAIATVVASSIEDYKNLNNEAVTSNKNSIDYSKLSASELVKKCKQNDYIGCRYQAKKLIENNLSSSVEKATNLYGKACKNNDADSCFELGNIYSNGKYILKNLEKARANYALACKQKKKESCLLLSELVDTEHSNISNSSSAGFKRYEIQGVTVNIPENWKILNESERKLITNSGYSLHPDLYLRDINSSKSNNFFNAKEPEEKAFIRISLTSSNSKEVKGFKKLSYSDKKELSENLKKQESKIIKILNIKPAYLQKVSNHESIVFDYIRENLRSPGDTSHVRIFNVDCGVDGLIITLSCRTQFEEQINPIFDYILDTIEF